MHLLFALSHTFTDQLVKISQSLPKFLPNQLHETAFSTASRPIKSRNGDDVITPALHC